MRRFLAMSWLGLGVAGFILGLCVYPIHTLATESGRTGNYRIQFAPIWERPPLEETHWMAALGPHLKKRAPNALILPGPTSRKRLRSLSEAAETLNHPLGTQVEPEATILEALGRALCRRAGLSTSSSLCIRVDHPKGDIKPPLAALKNKAVQKEAELERQQSAFQETIFELTGRFEEYLLQTESRLFEKKTAFEKELVDIKTQSERYRLVRDAEAEAAEVRLAADTSQAEALSESLRSRLTSDVLNTPESHRYLTREAIRAFRVPQSVTAGASMTDLRQLASLTEWFTLFSLDNVDAHDKAPPAHTEN